MEKIVIGTENAPKAVGPYNHAIAAGGFIYTSGQIPADPASGRIVDGGIKAQTHQVFANLKAVLQAGGAELCDVVKSTVFLVDMNDFTAVNEVYASYFDCAFPARSCVQVARLPRDVSVEIEMIAYIETK